MGVALAIIAGRRTYGDTAKTYVRIVPDTFCRLVRTGSQDDGAPEVKRITAVRKRNYTTERLRKIGMATHEGDKRSKTCDMLERVVPELRRLVENLTDKRKNLVAKTQIIFVVDAIIRHII